MPKADPNHTSSSVEEMAAVSFEALPAGELNPPPTLAAFMDSAGNTFNMVRLGLPLLTKTPDELVEIFHTLGEDEVLQFAIDVGNTKEWLGGLVRFLEALEARTWIATCRLAVGGHA